MISDSSSSTVKNHGWTVTFAGLGINLALGVLYTWSLFKSSIEKEFGWSGNQLNDPYALCCLVFAFAMILAGRIQDRFGPRVTASLGGLLVGAGMILISFSTQYTMWLLGFGVLVGLGIGFGYSSATPPALKWFPPSRTGLIAGLVVAGFGLAPVYISPLATFLLSHYGLGRSMLIFGLSFLVIVCGLAQLLRNPPPGYRPAGAPLASAKSAADGATPSQILAMPSFWLLWVVYFIASGAGLMVIGSVSGMAKKSMGESAFIAVAVMAIGNAGGRVAAGILSDRIGRRLTLALVCLLQALLMFAAIKITGGSSGPLIVLLATLIGFNYGANLSLFPSLTKDLWGLKSFGMNYGILFTAWGVGGFVMPFLSQRLKSASGDFNSSFYLAGGLLLFAAVLSLFFKSKSAES